MDRDNHAEKNSFHEGAPRGTNENGDAVPPSHEQIQRDLLGMISDMYEMLKTLSDRQEILDRRQSHHEQLVRRFHQQLATGNQQPSLEEVLQ